MEQINNNSQSDNLDLISEIFIIITDYLSINSGNLKRKIHIETIYSQLLQTHSLSKDHFSQLINQIKQYNILVYNRINIPRNYFNQNVSNEYPERQKEEGKIYCLILKDLKADIFYPECKNRIWKLGTYVWLPLDNKQLLDLIENEKIQIVSNII